MLILRRFHFDEYFTYSDFLLFRFKPYEVLRSALTSTRTESLVLTEQAGKDCVRLMSGEISVAYMVKEILARPAKVV